MMQSQTSTAKDESSGEAARGLGLVARGILTEASAGSQSSAAVVAAVSGTVSALSRPVAPDAMLDDIESHLSRRHAMQRFSAKILESHRNSGYVIVDTH